MAADKKNQDDGLTAFERAQIAEMREHNAKMQEIAAKGGRGEFVDASPNTQYQAMADARRGRDNPPLPQKVVRGVTSPTGGSFAFKIDHRGVVVDLLDYTWPAGCDMKMSEGGIVPDGYEIGKQLHKHWKWTDFRQADINMFVGKPPPKHMLADAKPIEDYTS
jgi:hypothetical protein